MCNTAVIKDTSTPQTDRLSLARTTPWAIKRCHFNFYDNFGRCGPISI